MAIQPMDSVVQVLALVASTDTVAICNGEGVSQIEFVAEGEVVLTLVEPIDLTPPDAGFTVFATPSAPANVLEITALDETHLRVRFRNPADGELRAGGCSLMLCRRHLPVVPAV